MYDTYDDGERWLPSPTEDEPAFFDDEADARDPDEHFIDPETLGLDVENSPAAVVARALAQRNDPSWAPLCVGLTVTALLAMVFTFTRLGGEAARLAPTWSAGGAAQRTADTQPRAISRRVQHYSEREIPCVL